MKNIIKTLFVMLTSVSLLSSANAGELGVSGTAKATYNINTGTHQAKGLGVTNELNFTASGELDNGYTWSYSMELDPADATGGGAATNDDTKLTLTTPYGTVGVFVLEGGLDAEDAASQSVYSRPTDMGDPSATVDNFTIDSYNNIQFHTPADLLPFATTVKYAYAPGLDGTNNSGNGTGAASAQEIATRVGTSAQEIRVDTQPIDGLKLGASYFEFNDQGVAKKNQSAESGAYYATYALGNITAGYSKAYRADLVADGGLNTNLEVEAYDQTNLSIAYVVNDDLSVSYEKETSEVSYQEGDELDVEQKSTGVQVAYNMGGMTLALARNTHDNVGYSTTAPKQDQTLFAVTMAF
jgi:outer membrane protein OmpU